MSYIEIDVQQVSSTAWNQTKAEVQSDLFSTFPPGVRYTYRIEPHLVRIANILVGVNIALLTILTVILIAGK